MKVAVIVGTRPEAIKLAPVILELRRHSDRIRCSVVSAGQHPDMTAEALAAFGLRSDVSMETMAPGQSLARLTSRLFHELDVLMARQRPDWVIVQGDTTSAMTAAMTAFYRRIKIGHVEAGLRTYDRDSPFPEEINRTVIGHLADQHFAPTNGAKENLGRAGVPDDRILVTGNTAVDAVLNIRGRKKKHSDERLLGQTLVRAIEGKRLLLVTSHRRESFKEGLSQICQALLKVVRRFEDTVVVYPVHPNPNVKEQVHRLLGQEARIHLLQPLGYQELVRLIERSFLVATDSGGLQEEVPSFGKPILILRETTERPEVIEAGCARLVGTSTDVIVANATELLTQPASYRRMAEAQSPFGDGHAAARIVARLLDVDPPRFEPRSVPIEQSAS